MKDHLYNDIINSSNYHAKKFYNIATEVTTVPMFVERKVRYSALFTNLVGWHAGAVSFIPSDIILVQLACPLSDVMFCLLSGRTNLSLHKHCSAQPNCKLNWGSF